jgi:hypothetical protein
MAASPFADLAFEAAADAYVSTPDRWELAVRAAIAGLFDFLAQRPDEATACLVGDGAAGSDGIARHERLIERFTALLRPGFEIAETPPAPVVTEAIGGGIYEVVRRYALERRLDQLPSAVPDATVVALAPFVGPDAARALASSTNVQAEG